MRVKNQFCFSFVFFYHFSVLNNVFVRENIIVHPILEKRRLLLIQMCIYNNLNLHSYTHVLVFKNEIKTSYNITTCIGLSLSISTLCSIHHFNVYLYEQWAKKNEKNSSRRCPYQFFFVLSGGRCKQFFELEEILICNFCLRRLIDFFF